MGEILLREAPVARHHIDSYLRGKTSLVELQKACQASLEQHPHDSPTTIKILAKLGNYGEQPEHLERDFWKLLWSDLETYDVPDPVNITITCKRGGRSKHPGAVERELPIILPTDWLHSMVQNQNILEKVLAGTPEQLEEFWDTESQRTLGGKHPVCELPLSSWRKYYPVALHGDDVQAFHKEKILVLSLHGVFVRDNPQEQHMLLCVIPYSWV